MKKILGSTLTAMAVIAGTGWAGSLDSPATPADATSAMPTINGLYDRLTTGAPGTARTGAFSEPSAGPAPSGHTMTDLLNAAPMVDSTNGASASDVKAGKTYWSLRTDSRWGLQAGTRTPASAQQSGQTSCYDAAGAVVTCAGTGQDGALRPGVAWPTPRYTDNNNGTVTDKLTGLVWLKNANCTETVGGITKASGTLWWADALTWSNNLASGKCGLSDGSKVGDWRVPSLFELKTLVDLQYANPALANTAGTGQWTSGNPFLAVQSLSHYWSSSTYVATPNNGWGVEFGSGASTPHYKASYPNNGPGYVWPVRGGQ